jgi:hypothetical protein
VWGDGSSFCSGAGTEVWFRWVRFPPEVIVLAVRCSLRYGRSYRDVEELLAEGGIEVDHVTVFRWVQRFTPLLIDEAGPCRHAPPPTEVPTTADARIIDVKSPVPVDEEIVRRGANPVVRGLGYDLSNSRKSVTARGAPIGRRRPSPGVASASMVKGCSYGAGEAGQGGFVELVDALTGPGPGYSRSLLG